MQHERNNSRNTQIPQLLVFLNFFFFFDPVMQVVSFDGGFFEILFFK